MRFVGRADEKLTAFVELQSAMQDGRTDANQSSSGSTERVRALVTSEFSLNRFQAQFPEIFYFANICPANSAVLKWSLKRTSRRTA
jgi:hypothetical protein